ncbi:MAG: RimK family alpha-L-glutamate ligase [Candidatus Shapirobacteria bacterium]
MDKKILVLIREKGQSKYEVGRIVKEGKKKNIEIKVALYRDLKFEIENGKTQVWVEDELINKNNFRSIYFRVAGTADGRYVEARNLLLRLRGDEIKSVNKTSYLNWPRMGKIAQYGVFVKNDIPVIETKIFYKKEQISLKEINYPVIIKHEMGYQGKSVRKIGNEEKLVKFLKKISDKDLGRFMWQKCLPTKWDIRVIVIGGKVIGAMKRTAGENEFRSNFSLGGRVEVWNLSDKDKEIAEKVAKVCGLDYGGVDIMKDEEGNSFVLEVNRQCQFRGFEQATGVNVAEKIVEFLA